MQNIEQEASHLESMSAKGKTSEAFKEFNALPKEDQLAVYNKMHNDAQQEGGTVKVENNQLIFNSPFNQAHAIYEK
jgi:hypothetical protein